jgi:hypothetical protein
MTTSTETVKAKINRAKTRLAFRVVVMSLTYRQKLDSWKESWQR